MTKIILTRHGHVEGIKPARFRGRTELPLTELGQAQAKAVAARIARSTQAPWAAASQRDRKLLGLAASQASQ